MKTPNRPLQMPKRPKRSPIRLERSARNSPTEQRLTGVDLTLAPQLQYYGNVDPE
jgi:hypothetical protein